jgi:hypothetical protein
MAYLKAVVQAQVASMARYRTVETAGVVEAVVDMKKVVVVVVVGIAHPRPHTVSVIFLSLSLPLPPAVSVLSPLHQASF